MPRRRRSSRAKALESKRVCPKCGRKPESVEELRKHVVKEWVLTNVSTKGIVTVTMMGVVECPKCGARYRTVIGKKKIEGSGKSPKERVLEIIREKKRISLKELSEQTKFSERALRIALEGYVSEGKIRGHFEGNMFVLDE